MKIASGLVLAAVAANAANAANAASTGNPTYLRSSGLYASTSDKEVPHSLGLIQSNDKVDDNQLELQNVLDTSEKTRDSKADNTHTFALSKLSDRNFNIADEIDTTSGESSKNDVSWQRDVQDPTVNDAAPLSMISKDFSSDIKFGSKTKDVQSLNFVDQSQVADAGFSRADGLSWLSNRYAELGEDINLNGGQVSTRDTYSINDYLSSQGGLTDDDATRNSYVDDLPMDEDCGSKKDDLQSLFVELLKTQVPNADNFPAEGLPWLFNQYSADLIFTEDIRKTSEKDFDNGDQQRLETAKDSSLFYGASEGTFLVDTPLIEDNDVDGLDQEKQPLAIKISSLVNMQSTPTIQNPVLMTRFSSISKYLHLEGNTKTGSVLSSDYDKPMPAKSTNGEPVYEEKRAQSFE